MMKKSFKTTGNNTQKNSLREKDPINRFKTGQNFKKTAPNDLSSKNNSKNLTKDKPEQKKSFSNKPVSKLYNKQLTTSDKKPQLASNKNLEQPKKNSEKTEIKKNITKKSIQTIAITNTRIVQVKTPSAKKDSTKRIYNLRINSSNPNLGSPLLTKIGKRKNLKEEMILKEEDISNYATDINIQLSPKKTDLSNNIFNIDELPSKMSSSFLIKTQEIFPKLVNNTFTKEATNTVTNIGNDRNNSNF